MSKLQQRLVSAIKRANSALAQQLLADGADCNQADRDGNRPLHHAASVADNEIVRLLLDAGADPDGRGYEQSTPLMRARSRGVGQLFIDRGADLTATDDEGLTPLMHAANLDIPDLVQLLLERGAAVNACSAIGATALIYAVYSRTMSFEEPERGDVVDLLLQAGADIQVKDKDNMTALKIARKSEGKGYVQYLKSKGAK